MQVTEARALAPSEGGRTATPRLVRAPELDWLRLGAVVLVLVVHAAQIFSPFESWHIESPDRSRLLGLLTAFAAPWIMPLFMLLAGAGAWYSLQRRTPLNWFRARALRLVVPLVLGTLLLIPPQVYLRRIHRGEFDGSFIQFYPRFFDGVFPEGNFSYGHLWFILYLFLYFAVALPLFQLLRDGRGDAVMSRLAAWCTGRMGILWGAVPFAIGQLVFRARYTQSTGAVFSDWATHAWLFTALLAGYALAAEPRLMAAVDRGWRGSLVPALLAWLALGIFVLQGDPYNRVPSEVGPWYLVFWSTFALASWAWIVVILGAARAHLRRSTPFLERWRGTAYGFYVLHQTVVVAVAYVVVGWPVDVHLRFLAVTAGSLLGTVVLVGLLKRMPGARAAFGIG
jgi:glucans biosynthesis protein C